MFCLSFLRDQIHLKVKKVSMIPGASSVRVLVGCECSQIIMSAFFEAGFDAYSCDLLPCEGGYPERHIQDDLLNWLEQDWDLLIAHPPCTYISYAATAYWNRPGRVFSRLAALYFFARIWESNIKHICIENPMGCADAVVAKHSQIIHPYYFGDNNLKRTCLWLKNLPKLEHRKCDDLFGGKTHNEKPEPVYIDKSGKKRYFTDAISGTNNGGHKRSKSFQGIAYAMVDQWGRFLLNSKYVSGLAAVLELAADG